MHLPFELRHQIYPLIALRCKACCVVEYADGHLRSPKHHAKYGDFRKLGRPQRIVKYLLITKLFSQEIAPYICASLTLSFTSASGLNCFLQYGSTLIKDNLRWLAFTWTGGIVWNVDDGPVETISALFSVAKILDKKLPRLEHLCINLVLGRRTTLLRKSAWRRALTGIASDRLPRVWITIKQGSKYQKDALETMEDLSQRISCLDVDDLGDLEYSEPGSVTWRCEKVSLYGGFMVCCK